MVVGVLLDPRGWRGQKGSGVGMHEWSMDITPLVLLLGLAPGYEPRYTVPVLVAVYGELGLLLALGEVALLSILLALLVDKLWSLFLWLAARSKLFSYLHDRVLRARRRASRLIERYGFAGLVAFIALPVPVTGMYTGAAVALLLGIPRRKTLLALAIGGSISVAIVYIASILAAHIV